VTSLADLTCSRAVTKPRFARWAPKGCSTWPNI